MEHQVMNVGRHPSQYFQRQLKDDCADRGVLSICLCCQLDQSGYFACIL